MFAAACQEAPGAITAGIHSRRRAADNLGVEDPEAEFRRWLEERALEAGT